MLVNNDVIGFEGASLVGGVPQYDETNGPGVFDSLIVSHYDNNLQGGPTGKGISIPTGTGFLIKNVSFVNFDSARCFMADCTLSIPNGFSNFCRLPPHM